MALDPEALGEIEDAVSNVVKEYLDKHERLRWPEPKLYMKCSDITRDIKREIEKKCAAIEIEPVNGHWCGPVSEHYRNTAAKDERISAEWRFGPHYEHDWLLCTHHGRSLLIDPTYVQFTGTKWSLEGCKIAATQYCMPHTSMRKA